MAFLNSILKNSSNHKPPFEHWELNQPLTDAQVQEIIKADIANPIEHNLLEDIFFLLLFLFFPYRAKC